MLSKRCRIDRDTNFKPNSFLTSSFLLQPRRILLRTSPDYRDLNSLSAVSALYLYTNPAPKGYGTPAPKIAETVLRANGFNLKNESKEKTIGEYTVNWPAWEEEGEYPFDQITGNFHPGEAHQMFKRMLVDNFDNISRIAKDTIADALQTNSDVLTKGRQTFDCIKETSVSSSTAYQVMSEIYKLNLKKDSSNCLEWIQMFFECMNLDSMITLIREKRITSVKYRTCKYTKIKRRVVTYKFKWIRQTIQGNEKVRKYMFELSTSFCGYIKHGERAKLNRRAIASPNIIKRMFLKIIEDFHLELGKVLAGSTISIGGEEKKKKIIANTDADNTSISNIHMVIQATQDATKFNECLTADVFTMMHRTFFDDEVRNELNLTPVTAEEKLFLKIATASHWILTNKKIMLGEGIMGYTKDSYNRIPWEKKYLYRMNKFTKDWFERILPYFDGKYVRSSQGMLMGMHNAASTTLGLAAVNYNFPFNCRIIVLRSSDDSMSVYIAYSLNGLWMIIELDRKNLKMLGINLSPDKTFFFERGFGEYTSWFIDGAFVSQYGVETSAMKPQGKNPHDDFHSVAKSVQIGLLNNIINPLGAECWLRVGVDNVRRLYKINKRETPRENIRMNLHLLSDGGPSGWDIGNCHLEETALKEFHARSDKEKEYFLRINNPENPFAGPPGEEIMYSRETNQLVVSTPEIPRNCFTFLKRSNRANANRRSDKKLELERASTEAMKITNSIDFASNLQMPSTKVPLADYIADKLEDKAIDLVLSEEENNRLQAALRRLRGSNINEEEDCPGLFGEDLDSEGDYDEEM